MKSLKYDTLSFQLGVRPGVQLRDMGARLVPRVVDSLNKFMKDDRIGESFGFYNHEEKPKGVPEVDALVFYMLNHAVSVIRQNVHPLEPLGEYLGVVQLYHQELALRSARMFFYLLLICTRESRHAKNDSSSAFWSKLHTNHGAGAAEFHKSIIGSGSEGAASKLRNKPPNTTLFNYTNLLVDVFYKGHFSPSFGGPAWGSIADVLRDFAQGKITAEMMMDTAFTLCHNNGPIFNKGMLFDSYSEEVYKILDVQRSGQIPQLVGNDESKFSKNPVVKKIWAKCAAVLPSEFGGYVDWYKVEALGSMKSYPAQKSAQVSKYGHPNGSKAVELSKKVKAAMASKVMEDAESMWVEIMPGVKVKKVEVLR